MRKEILIALACVLIVAEAADLTCNGPHESIRCVPECPPPRTCKNRGIRYKCAVSDCCTNKCLCDVGYYRNSKGDCISSQDCERCTGPHEYFSCGGACDNVCATLHEQSQQNCPIRNIKCNEMCYCDEGYARDAGGVCVPIQQCTS